MMATDGSYQVDRVGIFRPKQETSIGLGLAKSGFFTAAIKEVADTRVGDTVTDEKNPTSEALPGFKPAQPVVFCGFSVDAADFEDLRDAMGRLRLNDASFSFETESSAALGFGFRCGFLGLLHLEIITERLEREFNLDLITTAPSVIYHLHMNDGTISKCTIRPTCRTSSRSIISRSPGSKPRSWCRTLSGRRFEALPGSARPPEATDLRRLRAMVIYELPLNEVVFDFYDRLKSVSRGYASFDYHIVGYEEGDLVKLSILVNGEPVDALSIIVHKARAESRGRRCAKS